jgi:hypothetical protein
MQFVTFAAGDDIPPGKRIGDPKLIPIGTRVKVTDVRLSNRTVFALTQSEANPPRDIGWTSTVNFAGAFINATLGEFPPIGTSKKGANAAWEDGEFLAQLTLVKIVDSRRDVESITLDTLPAYEALVAAAAGTGVRIAINSGFRTFREQEELFTLHQQDPVHNAVAARPGFSKHQNGVALDIAVGGFDGDPIYDWLKVNGPRHGFIRTVSGEPWHWEFRPKTATQFAATGKFKLASVNP